MSPTPSATGGFEEMAEERGVATIPVVAEVAFLPPYRQT
jgi:hypothetical protein